HASGEDAEPRAPRRFAAVVEEHLKPEADAEVGGAAADRVLERVARASAEGRAAIAEAPLAGHDDLVRASKELGVARQGHARPAAGDFRGTTERSLDAPKVAEPYIRNGNLHTRSDTTTVQHRVTPHSLQGASHEQEELGCGNRVRGVRADPC